MAVVTMSYAVRPALFVFFVVAGRLVLAQEPIPEDPFPPPAAPAPATAPASDPSPAPAPATPPATATTTGRILGRVTDSGRPVSGAQVRLVSRSESGLLRVTSTNER